MKIIHKGARKGFTLLEVLLVIAAIGVLASIVLVAINPNRQIEAARNAKRRSDINTIQKAIQQYSIDNNGQYPVGIETGAKAICRGGTPVGCIDLSNILAPTYIASIPEPDSNYYYVRRSNNNIEVSHPRDNLWNIGGTPSLDLNFASNKSLIDSVSGKNLVTFTRASSGTYVDSAGVLQTASTDIPRFDHNPTTGESLGLLVEEQRTNLLVRSEEFDSSPWSANKVTVTANAIASPTGDSTADKISHNALSVGDSGIQSGASISSPSVFSVFVKSAEYTNLHIREFVSTGVQATFNLSTGTVGTSNATAGIQAVGNGWYRVYIMLSSISTATNVSFNMFGVNSSAYQWPSAWSPVSGNGIYLWGAQLEAGPLSSYIPTTTATVTRAADVASITGSAFSGWYNPVGGTVFLQASTAASTANPYVFRLDDTTNSNRIEFRRIGASNTSSLFSQVGGVTQFNAGISGAWPANTEVKYAAAFATNDGINAVNGSLSSANTSGTLPVVTQAIVGSSSAGSGVNAPIRRLIYWPARLPNANLQRITQ